MNKKSARKAKAQKAKASNDDDDVKDALQHYLAELRNIEKGLSGHVGRLVLGEAEVYDTILDRNQQGVPLNK